MSRRHKFIIRYPRDHRDEMLRGTKYKPVYNSMVVMNGDGIFFLICMDRFYPSIQRLSNLLPVYDVEWVKEGN